MAGRVAATFAAGTTNAFVVRALANAVNANTAALIENKRVVRIALSRGVAIVGVRG